MNKTDTPAKVASNAGLGVDPAANADDSDLAFWANLVIAHVWMAAGSGFPGKWSAVVFLAMCVAIRWPRWSKLYRSAVYA